MRSDESELIANSLDRRTAIGAERRWGMRKGSSERDGTIRRRHRRTVAAALLFLVLAWAIAPAAMIWRHGTVDGARSSDCIIVLGAAAYHRRPSPVFEERIRHALALYRQGLADTIIFTGGYGVGAPFAESEVGRAYALRHGVPANAILTERVSRTTLDNLRQAKHLMRDHHLATAIIVSDPLHLKRAAMMASHLHMDAVTSPTPSTRFRSWSSRLRFLARETYFFHAYLYLGI